MDSRPFAFQKPRRDAMLHFKCMPESRFCFMESRTLEQELESIKLRLHLRLIRYKKAQELSEKRCNARSTPKDKFEEMLTLRAWQRQVGHWSRLESIGS